MGRAALDAAATLTRPMLRLHGAALVIGAEGFVGSHMTGPLAESGLTVVGAGRRPRTDAPLERWHTIDVRDADAVERLVTVVRPSVVVHLAGVTHLPKVLEAPAEAFQVNVVGTRNVLEAVRRHAPAARVLLVSSAAVYGSPSPDLLPLDEDSPLLAEHPYGVQKIAVECLGERYRADFGVPIVIARPFNHLGLRQEARFAASSFADKLAAIEVERAPAVMKVGNLEPRRDILDVRDVVSAYIRLLQMDDFEGTYVVARGRSTRIGDILDLFLKHARCPVTVESDPSLFRKHDAPDLVGSPARLRARTGWEPTVPLEETLLGILDEARARIRTREDRAGG